MSKLPPCHLTTKDFSFLELLRERAARYDEAYLQLLREKLSTATVVFQDDIEPQVATINSRVYFTVASALADSRILVCGGDFHFPGVTLPITTMRGLALLGLKAGEAIAVRQSDGGNEEVRLDRVSHQPEAKRKERVIQPKLSKEKPEQKSPVIAFQPRLKPTLVKTEAMHLDSEPDDPGPNAA